MKKAIIIGASSGIGSELAKVLSREGYVLGLAARRLPLLKTLQKELPTKSFVRKLDISSTTDIENAFNNFVKKMSGVDLVVISSATGHINRNLDWEPEEETIRVNVTGFCKAANLAVRHFMKKGKGHLVGISSIAAIRGGRAAPAYNASKAFVSNYLEGIRGRMKKRGIDVTVTDIMPGFVDTAMAKGNKLFWVAPADKAAKQIYRAIQKRRNRKYVTRRWALVAFILRILPDRLYLKF